MSKNQSFKIDPSQSGQRLDRALQALTSLSRKKIKALLDSGKVYLNQRKVIIASWVVKKGDVITLQEEEVIDSSKHFLKVIHEDADLLVIEKDPGVSCEKSAIETKPSVVAIINAYFKRRYPHLKHHYLGLVHRLDRDTSGLMVYTKTKEANGITQQFKKHTIKRKYLAIVEGRIESQGGTIESYLKKSNLLPGGKKVTLSTPESGQRAVTQFRVLERYANATLIEVTLNTGRTHQIRVQMAAEGYPVVGDRIYGGKKGVPFSRQALHACYLSFHHPITGDKMEFKSELPRDMRRLVDRLRTHS